MAGSEFTPQHEWVLEPGDVLYPPSSVVYREVALKASLSYSTDFAPCHWELLSSFLGLPAGRHRSQDPLRLILIERCGIIPAKSGPLRWIGCERCYVILLRWMMKPLWSGSDGLSVRPDHDSRQNRNRNLTMRASLCEHPCGSESLERILVRASIILPC